MKAIIIIPARMASTRFPNKPLACINGKPMIIHVAERAEEANIGNIYIACAEQEIADIARDYGYNAILTDPNHISGTDRIFEAAQKISLNDENYDVIINVQGDLPTIDPDLIQLSLEPFSDDNIDISTLVCKILDKQEINNPNIVKAIINWNTSIALGKRIGCALDFLRNAACASDGEYYHHIGLYAYRKEALKKFVNFKPTHRELSERLEQLRALENGMRISAVDVQTVPIGVDTIEDLEKARAFLKNNEI